MLIFTRKQGESFYIGDSVQITVLEIAGDKVKVGIQAPPEVPVIRAELRDTERANLAAAGSRAGALGKAPALEIF